MRALFKRRGVRGSVVTIALLFGLTAHAAVMQSSSYKIQNDSMNMGGGLGTSASYKLESTAGEIASGRSQSASYALSAGYLQTLVSYLSMTPPSNVVMSPTIGGVTGGTADGTAFLTVITDSTSGYQLSIRALTSPAMQSGANTIPDYVPAGANPDYSFSVTGNAGFGFSPEGDDVASRYRDNGSSCNTGVTDTTFACWDALTTTDRVIAQLAYPNNPTGSDLYIRFRTGLNANSGIAAGDYYATTTVTAIAL